MQDFGLYSGFGLDRFQLILSVSLMTIEDKFDCFQ